MRKRTLGNSGLTVSAIGFGCMGISFGYRPAATREDGWRSFGRPLKAA